MELDINEGENNYAAIEKTVGSLEAALPNYDYTNSPHYPVYEPVLNLHTSLVDVQEKIGSINEKFKTCEKNGSSVNIDWVFVNQ